MASDPFANLRHSPRPYQVEAFSEWQTYFAKHDSSRPLQLLFNMATGSGKTYLMATLMLDLYAKGYRNFVFFVNSLNILEKTRDNFINSGSPKYLFQPNIFINQFWVRIREVTNFADSDPSAINILFTTTQRLHADLNQPHENRLTLYDFTLHDVVLIGDEAHHNNVQSLSDKRDERSWENTINQIMSVNPQTLLLEFTATLDFDNPNIVSKYHERVLYRYDLRQFCQEKYSKIVSLYRASPDLDQRIIEALLLSELRQLVAQKFHLPIKPVIMFKSRTIHDNQSNLRRSIQLITELKPEQLVFRRSSELKQLAEKFFASQGITPEQLCDLIKTNFAPDRLIRIDGGRTISTTLQHQINTLEAPANFYRAIFAVDMLKEGWDVLNLFDIVRLYDEYRPQKTTLSEVQLIGRGARYCPFKYHELDPYKRKFDHDPDNELRVLEQLHYHTTHDVEYITELQQSLIAAGLIVSAHGSAKAC